MKRDTKAFLREAVLTGATLAFCAAMPFAGLHAAAAIVTAPPVASNEVSARGPAPSFLPATLAQAARVGGLASAAVWVPIFFVVMRSRPVCDVCG